MNAARFVGLAINVSLVLMVFGVALKSGAVHAGAIFRSPGLAARSFIAIFVAMPLVAILVALNLDLQRELLVTLLLVALSPVPPVLPSKQLKSGGDPDYVFGLLLLTAIGAILVIPGGVELIGRIFGRELVVHYSVAARVVAISLLLPVVAGLLVARYAPGIARRFARPASLVGFVLLVAAFLPVLWKIWGAMTGELQNFTVVTMAGFAAIGLAVGHLLGGPVPGNRTALALATATRHPGVALAIVQVLDLGERSVAPVVLLYLLVSVVVSAPYLAWRRRRLPAAARA